MSAVLSVLSTAFDLLLVVLGFSAIIVVHELGHFLAARWAGIRVLAFSVGFGPALLSYRKGIGFRRASTEPQYLEKLAAARQRGEDPGQIPMSPTEYRLNVLPLGGYVKMLGQDDADPSAKSDEPDSYQRCVPWKRMVVISAGVVANVILAAILFVIVFKVGLLSEPAKVGEVAPGSPAAVAIADNAGTLGVTEPGLRPGDEILSVNGEKPNHYSDVFLAVAMAKRESTLTIDVRREGVGEPLRFGVRPQVNPQTGLLAIGIEPMASTQISPKLSPEDFDVVASASGLAGLKPGMRLVAIDGVPATTPYAVQKAVDRSGGSPITLSFETLDARGRLLNDGARTEVRIEPRTSLQQATVEVNETMRVDVNHLVGLTPVLAVQSVTKGSAASVAGLERGDVFVQVGSAEWPSIAEGIAQIRAHRDKPITLVVARQDASGAMVEVQLEGVKVGTDGRIGFAPTDSAQTSTLVAGWPTSRIVGGGSTPTGASLPIKPGSRIAKVDGQPVADLGEIRERLKAALASGRQGVELTVELPISRGAGGADAPRPMETIAWTLTSQEIAQVQALGWKSPLDTRLFEPERFVWRSSGIGHAIAMGVHETHRVMMSTYLTFARLVQGTVKFEHLKGPVGIAHTGVMIAERGPIWLMFFLALISVNLAVINFLPIPIADGGHMVFLIYEQITGKPPPASVQNASAVVGLVLLGAVFIVVTFHDVGNLVTHVSQWISR